jgi:hypothetical protein
MWLKPKPPKNPRIQLPNGDTIPLRATYTGRDKDGIHTWTLAPTAVEDFAKLRALDDVLLASVVADQFPTRTSCKVALNPDWPRDMHDLCTCFHGAHRHADGGIGRCQANDSYDQPCACPSFEHDPTSDEI